MKFFTCNLSIHFKQCQNFQQSANWKNPFKLKYYTFHKYHTSFNLVGGLKLQQQWKSINLMRGFPVSLQYARSNSKNLWHNSFKNLCKFGEKTAELNRACKSSKNVRLLCYEEFYIFSTDFKENKNVIMANISKSENAIKNRRTVFYYPSF